jgi:hypothetical protein
VEYKTITSPTYNLETELTENGKKGRVLLSRNCTHSEDLVLIIMPAVDTPAEGNYLVSSSCSSSCTMQFWNTCRM